MILFKRLFPHPVLTFILWVFWLLLNNTLAMGHVVLGLVLAIWIPFLTARFWPEKVCIHSPLTLAKFILVVLWDIFAANLIVAKLILGKTEQLKPGFFELELDIKTPLGISLLANTISLTPGTVSCVLSVDQRHLLIHALHLEDEAATIQAIKQRYEWPLKEVFYEC